MIVCGGRQQEEDTTLDQQPSALISTNSLDLERRLTFGEVDQAT